MDKVLAVLSEHIPRVSDQVSSILSLAMVSHYMNMNAMK